MEQGQAASEGRPSPFENQPSGHHEGAAPPPPTPPPKPPRSHPALAGGFRLTDRMQESSILWPVTTSGPESEIFTAAHSASKWPHGLDVLFVPDLRKKLKPRPSPFVSSNYFGGGFVSDKDRVYLASLVHGPGGGHDFHGIEHSRKDMAEGLDPVWSPRQMGELVPGAKAAAAAGAGADAGAGAGAPRGVLDLAAEVADSSPGPKSDDALPAISTKEQEEGEGEDLGVLRMPRFALRAGPREVIYHNPHHTKLAIVTVGGLCPGLNDVIRSIVSKATDYGVPEGNIRGIQFGFQGFKQPCRGGRHAPIRLTVVTTDEIHLEGGTMLGTSSARPDIKEIVKWLDLWGIDVLFVVGGIGGIGVARQVVEECERQGVVTSVVAVPKSIDNDLLLIDKTFGFDTAVEEAQKALLAAKVEASSAYRGVGIVKLMGRRSGFIAVKATLASGLVDVCLIPEVAFKLNGEQGLLAHLEQLLERKGHAVICVAEGTAQDMIPSGGGESDAADGDTMGGPEICDHCSEGSGGSRDGPGPGAGRGDGQLKDVAAWLKKEIKSHLEDVDVKCIEPSYIIRSVQPTSNDRVLCKQLAHAAVHAGFAGYTGCMMAVINTHFAMMPLIAGLVPRRVSPRGALWSRLRASTGQPQM